MLSTEKPFHYVIIEPAGSALYGHESARAPQTVGMDIHIHSRVKPFLLHLSTFDIMGFPVCGLEMWLVLSTIVGLERGRN